MKRQALKSTETSKTRDNADPSIEDLETGLRIDEHALDDALVQHPDLFYRVSKQLALLTSQRDAKKQELAEQEAKADGDIRETASKHKDKVTETEVKNMIRLDADVSRVLHELLDLNRQVGSWTALKEAFQARSYVLKDLVNLYIANYYGSNQDGGSSAGRALRNHSASHVREELKTRRQRYDAERD